LAFNFLLLPISGNIQVTTFYGTYSLRPLLSIVVGVCATSLTRFIENTCNICIFK
jgi:NADH:ubiquinone oxidoreductase subunit E